MRVLTKDSREFVRSTDVAPGFPESPLTKEEHLRRLRDCLEFATTPVAAHRAKADHRLDRPARRGARRPGPGAPPHSMKGRQSAGILAYHHATNGVEVFLVHPGGPYWKRKDAGAWSIPKGLLEPGEDPRAAARREFAEEAGVSFKASCILWGRPSSRAARRSMLSRWKPTSTRRPSGATCFKWSGPPKSGRTREFPEVDAGAWFPVDLAYEKILIGQRVFLDRLTGWLAEAPGPAG